MSFLKHLPEIKETGKKEFIFTRNTLPPRTGFEFASEFHNKPTDLNAIGIFNQKLISLAQKSPRIVGFVEMDTQKAAPEIVTPGLGIGKRTILAMGYDTISYTILLGRFSSLFLRNRPQTVLRAKLAISITIIFFKFLFSYLII